MSDRNARARRIEGACWLASAGLAVVIAWSSHDVRQALAAAPTTVSPEPSSKQANISSAARVDASAMIEANVFSRERRYTASATPAPATVTVASPPAPRPQLTLRGILGGPPWTALIAGIPGREESIVAKPGDIINGFTVRSVNRDGVIVRGADTTWHLALSRPW